MDDRLFNIQRMRFRKVSSCIDQNHLIDLAILGNSKSVALTHRKFRDPPTIVTFISDGLLPLSEKTILNHKSLSLFYHLTDSPIYWWRTPRR